MTIHKLGRIKSKFDSRDFNLRSFIPRKESEVLERCWDFPQEHLDQKDTGHCCGFGLAGFRINFPTNTPQTNADGDAYYYLCKEVDGEPRKENGSTVRSVAKVAVNLNIIDAYAFAPDMASIRWWLLNKGPVMVGTMWTSDMFAPDKNNIIKPTGGLAGGHFYLLNEWTIDNFIGIQNSWANWGENSKAYISATDFEKIFIYDGEALTAVELEGTPPYDPPVPEIYPDNPGCFSIATLKRMFGK